MSLRAGSEKIKDTGATGERLKESVQINASLMTLNKVLRTLSQGKKVLGGEYRESRLTTILKESLGGNCRTTLLLATSPSGDAVAETTRTLDVGTFSSFATLTQSSISSRASADSVDLLRT